MRNYVIGVDVGGTNIRVARINTKLEMVTREAALTTDFKTAEDFLTQLKEMIERADPEKIAKAIGIVLPAPWTIEKKTITDATNVPYLENITVEKLKEAFPDYLVYLENDVNVIALLESDFGAAKNSKNSVYITVSTGIGSGVIINNRIYHGAHGYAGEIGSIIISDKKCTKANPLRGSLEEVCSGKALDQKSADLYGQGVKAITLFMRYEDGDQKARKALKGWFDDLTRGLAAVIQMMDPDVIVLGGPIMLNHKWIIEKIKKELPNKVLGQLADKTKIAVAEYGLEAGTIGAGYYAFKKIKGVRK